MPTTIDKKSLLEEIEVSLLEAQDGKPRRLIENFFMIRDEHDEIVPFKYNDIQSNYDETSTLRDVKNKPRKIGFSTQSMAEAYAFSIAIPNFEVLALTYDDEETSYLFGMVDTFHENMPEILRPKPTAHSTTHMELLNKSSLTVQTAGGKRKGRGRTPSYVLLDEMAQYDETQQEEIYTSIMGSVPPWARVRIQSTPKGIGNKFHSLYTGALDGTEVWSPFFYPWMWMPEKHTLELGSQHALGHDRGHLNYTQDEQNLIERWNAEHPEHPINEDNIRWRRMRQSDLKETFGQEFPEDDITCFIATSETVFPTDELNMLVSIAREPLHTQMDGDWKTWRRPEPGRHYCIGVDCASGIVGRDYSGATIGTDDGEVVATIKGYYGETEMARIVYDAAMMYNEAFVLNERQNAYEFQRVLTQDLNYKNVYRHRDNAGFQKPERDLPLGFPTTGGGTMAGGNKNRLIETMRTALKSDGFRCPDKAMLRELVEYKQHRDGTFGAPKGKGKHDDMAMSAMLYLLGLQAMPFRRRGRNQNTNSSPVKFDSVEVFG
ncbi:hypothetical protein CMI37_19525 [Candidatus Pacearchaeota archaeon]|nr:hypothetical protein [Candidatus Pacearchaeota archaeon]|tara:strand:+ start:273 stop:1913 length:1641 start_codon:yes stop_codon:yes gene_type:complete